MCLSGKWVYELLPEFSHIENDCFEHIAGFPKILSGSKGPNVVSGVLNVVSLCSSPVGAASEGSLRGTKGEAADSGSYNRVNESRYILSNPGTSWFRQEHPL
jgi:hypothetical protein